MSISFDVVFSNLRYIHVEYAYRHISRAFYNHTKFHLLSNIEITSCYFSRY